jgi:hypothetical protein
MHPSMQAGRKLSLSCLLKLITESVACYAGGRRGVFDLLLLLGLDWFLLRMLLLLHSRPQKPFTRTACRQQALPTTERLSGACLPACLIGLLARAAQAL